VVVVDVSEASTLPDSVINETQALLMLGELELACGQSPTVIVASSRKKKKEKKLYLKNKNI